MNPLKKVLVTGGTGAMGQYLVPMLAQTGYDVDVASLDERESPYPNVKYHKVNLMDHAEFSAFLGPRHYDGIVDFMIYDTQRIATFIPIIMDHADHYIFLSSYRVYDDKEIPVRETSPRLLESSDNAMLRSSDDYGIYKARGEDFVRAYGTKMNWTIVRPAITYSFLRYQLVTLEAPDNVGRAFANKLVPLPIQAKNVQATMSWAGDVARLFSRLLFNENALGETYSITTSEHHTWGEIADYYRDICNLKAVWIDKEDYIRLKYGSVYNPFPRWQLEYDRLLTRIMDNSKILNVTGIRQADFKPLYDGLAYEIGRCPRNRQWPVNKLMDEYFEK